MRALAVIASLVIAASASGQGRPSSIVGTLTDPDGRAVASATVHARDSAGTVFRGTTNARGEYVLNRLPAGTYALTVPAIGFSLNRFEQRDIAIGVAQTLRVDVRLQWGSNLGTPGDDQSVFNLRKYGTDRGAAPRTRDGKPDFSGMWIGNNDPDPEEPALLPWAAAAVQARIANAQPTVAPPSVASHVPRAARSGRSPIQSRMPSALMMRSGSLAARRAAAARKSASPAGRISRLLTRAR